MPYIVRRQTPYQRTVTEKTISDDSESQEETISYGDQTGTITRIRVPTRFEIKQTNIPHLIEILETYCNQYQRLFEKPRQDLYQTFYIPKQTGGLRRIDAPREELMDALRELKGIFERHFNALYHTSAFAYVSGRSTIDAVKKHQYNESKWFLKTDFSDFFGSTSKEFIEKSLSVIFPFSEVVQSDVGKQALSKAVDLCMLNGGLPQGTPISPMLTNLIMIPIDYALFNTLAKEHFVYTRYADDILISNKRSFDPDDIQNWIARVLKEHHAPYVIKKEKTRYASSSGSNWNLGVMLNKDNEITVGYQKKKQFKAMVNSFILDHLNQKPWPLDDVNYLAGLLSYYTMVERDYFNHMIDAYNTKYHVDFRTMLKNAQKGSFS